ncbi:type II secretion system protein [Campylobacter sp. faydin G-24]|uniref:Type II secretion system protein n=1 Tax=Campylobacter anatolicus TaxID=2829105 RepID=A0ABS5HJE3_9BACT|nr:type II secretion system protein [Campylobacter anatolicus]MBR8464385.1 type II secretion system protein [Campylobacter anatolicus]
MRDAFSLITAIFFMILVSALSILALSFANFTSRQSGEIYLREQAELLAQGATEVAMLKAFKHDFNSGCLKYISGKFTNDDVNILLNYEVYIKFFGDIAACRGEKIQTPQSVGTMMIDVFVYSPDTNATNKISFHKRTLQKL